jgi:hypothetical protein
MPFKGNMNADIQKELMQLFDSEVSTAHTVKYWAHELFCGQSVLWNLLSPDRPLLDDIDTKILAMFELDPFSIICSLVDRLNIAPSPSHYHLTDVLYFQLFHLRWVSYDLTDVFISQKPIGN